MLELIILGLSPGSQTQITFGQAIALWTGFLAVLCMRIKGGVLKDILKTEVGMLLIYLSLRFNQKSFFARWQNTLPIKLKLF